MKKLICSLTLVLCLWQTVSSQTTVGGQQVITLPSSPWATTQALLSLPSDYDSTSTETFPLILWLHGVGQAGTDISNLLTDQGGLPYRISQGFIPEAISPVDHKMYKFIVVEPQAASWSYQYQQIQFILPGILAKYRVDTTRIYITGLSAGGNGALTCITDDPYFCGKIAAVSVMSAASITPTEAAAMKNVDINHLPFWDICGTADPNGFYPPNVAYVDSVWANGPNPTPDSTWLYNVGHSSWFQGYDPTWTGRSGHSNGLNMYEWFLLWQRGVTIPWGPVAGSSLPPSPVAGVTSKNMTITLPLDSVSLNATPSTPPSGGTITSYQWSYLSGPSTYLIRSTASATTELTNLVQGTYQILLTVTGNLGGVALDTVTVIVNPSAHTPPTVTISPSTTTITEPTNSTTLSGTATDVGGTITGYNWTYVSGPTAYSLVNGTTASATLSNLVSGTYVFQLTVTDNLGATGVANDTVVVNPPVTANAPPVAASTNNNISITLPLDSTALNGSPSAPPSGGTITGYSWSLLSGPSGDVIENPTSAIATITGLTSGTYKVVLTVTDNQGQSATDTVTVTVNPAGSAASSCGGHQIMLAQQGDQGITLNGPGFAYAPGDTLVIPAVSSPYTWLDFTDIYGTPTCPVVITNGGGQVWATVRFNCGNCRYVHMDGTGTPGVQYGFLLHNAQKISAGIDVYGRSSYVEMNNISIHNMDYGIWVKQDQGCIDSLNYPNWTIDHISIHDNSIVGTYDEGMYLGTTDPNGTRIVTCNGVQPNPLPKPLYLSNFSIYNNYIDSTGRSGIQLSDAETGDNEIYNNRISNNGLQLNSQQGNGISLGGYTSAHVHNNLITNTFTMGIFSLGAGPEVIDHNTISLSGHLEGGSPGSASIMVDTRPTIPVDSTTFNINNNTLGTNTDFNIRVYQSWPAYGYNNNICSNTGPGGGPATFNVVSGVHVTNTCTTSPPGNGAPVARAGGSYTTTLPVNTVALNGSGSTDATAPIVGYTWTYISGPGAPMLANASTATPTLSNLQVGIYKYVLTITDSTGTTATDTATITVNPASLSGTGPVANAGSKTDTVYLPTDWAYLNGTGSYARGGATLTSYQWTVVSGPSGSSITTATSATATLTNAQTAGTYVVVLTVTDNNGLTASDTERVYVLNYSQIPVAVISNTVTTLTLPTNLVLDGSESYAGPNTYLVSWQWTETAGPNTVTFTSATSPTTGVNGLIAGTYTFQLTVTDVEGQPGTATITFTVTGSGGGPVANAGGNQTITLPTNSVNLSGAASTESGSGTISFYQWTVISGPSQYSFSSPTSVTTSLGNLTEGVYTVQLQVIDNNGVASTATVTITVNAAPVPPTAIINASDTSITLPASLSLDGSASTAPSGTSITGYQWTEVSGPNSAAIASPAGATTSVTGLTPGTYVFQLTVTDGQGLSASTTVKIRVVAATGGPQANAGGNQTITLPLDSVTLDGSASSETGTGTITSYTWTILSGPAGYSLENGNSTVAELTNLSAGTYQVQLSVTDNNGITATDIITITVVAVAEGHPVSNAGGNLTIALPTDSVTLNGSGSTEVGNGNIVNYTWTVISGPSQYDLVNGNSATAGLGNLTVGVYTLELIVTDNWGNTAGDTITVTVNPPTTVPVAIISNTDTLITVSDSTVALTLDGTQSYAPPGSTITSYQWTQVAGPNTAVLGSAGSSTTTVGGLAPGAYLFQLTVTDNLGRTGTATIVIHVRSLGAGSATIYPNPCQDQLNVALSPSLSGKVTLLIYDVRGDLIQAVTVEKNEQTPLIQTLNTTGLSTGMYFLRITVPGDQQTFKFIKVQ